MATLESRIRLFFEAGPPDVVAVYLFGSRGRGDDRPGSDVDVGVLLDEKPPSRLDHPRFQLATELETTLGSAVDVVVMNDAALDLVHRILRDGRLLLDRNPSRRIAFEVKARNDYFDLLPVLNQYRKPKEPA